MTFLIRGLPHDLSGQIMARHSFSIDLSPEWRDAVARSRLTQEHINAFIETCGRQWLDCAGYGGMFDPDNCGFDRDKSKPPGPNARRSYEPRTAIRVLWGEWGPEHITVPGSAAGLDIDRHTVGSLFDGGRLLNPHNVDSLSQKYLLLMVFCEIAETVHLQGWKEQ